MGAWGVRIGGENGGWARDRESGVGDQHCKGRQCFGSL